MAELFPKRCKVYPRNGLQFIPGILEKQKRIEFPAELPLSEKELRRCLSYADVYEVTDGGDVLLTTLNYLSDNSEATPATDVPEDELLYPRDEKEEEDDEEKEEEADKGSETQQSAKTASVPNKAAKDATYSAKQQQSKQQTNEKQAAAAEKTDKTK